MYDLLKAIKLYWCYLVDLYNYRRCYLFLRREYGECVWDKDIKGYTIVFSRKKFKKHKRSGQLFIYHSRTFICARGYLHEKGWWPIEELEQQENYFDTSPEG